ncbi:MFS transporter [Actinospica durhamensis]|uniref:MFS transporter n=1 Tax=Actinospica durhamensis TaxID=1508375 RepID=A0A941ENW0_9ACTN|nr:MFS transporter [Actinospica durhamensis]MBR7834535.1 MFS transporter [Actinospica durhamensis]
MSGDAQDSEGAASGPLPRLEHIRDFRLLWVGGLLAGLGAQMSILALPLLVLRRTGSAVEAGMVGSVALIALLAGMLPGGALADVVERRRLLLLCSFGSMLAAGALALSVFLGAAQLPLVLLVAAFGAVINSVDGPAALGLLRAVIPPELFGAAASRMQARAAAARVIGPLLGGALFALDPALPFTGEAVCLLLSIACLALVRTRSAPSPGGAAFSRTSLLAGFAFLWDRPYLRTVLLVFGLGMNAAFGALMFVVVAVASHRGGSGLDGGTVVSLTAVGSLTGSLLAPRVPDRLRPGTRISCVSWACALLAALLPISRNPLYSGGLCALCVAVASVAGISFLTTLVTVTPDDLIGRVQSAAGLLSSLVQPLAPLAGGALLTAWGDAATYRVLAVVFVVCAVVLATAPSVRGAPAAVRGRRLPATG